MYQSEWRSEPAFTDPSVLDPTPPDMEGVVLVITLPPHRAEAVIQWRTDEPSHDNPVLVVRRNGEFLIARYFRHTHPMPWFCTKSRCLNHGTDVVAWAELPEPPVGANRVHPPDSPHA